MRAQHPFRAVVATERDALGLLVERLECGHALPMRTIPNDSTTIVYKRATRRRCPLCGLAEERSADHA